MHILYNNYEDKWSITTCAFINSSHGCSPNYPEGNYVFQQDGAPAHTSKRTEEFNLVAVWTKEMWPPQSPDLNPLDYSIWANVEKDA